MKRIALIFVCQLILGVTASFAQDVAYNFINKVTFTKNGNGHICKFVAMMPLPQSNQYQDIANLTYSGGEKLVEKRYGNHILFANMSEFSGNKYVMSSSFAVHPIPVRVDVSKITNIPEYDPNSEACRLHLGDRGEYIVTSNPYIVETGNRLWNQSSNVIDYARRCYEHVAQNFSYINGSWRTLSQILTEGGGECGDFSTLVVNLLRYKGIPSRHNICLRLNGGYHVWADFYVEGYGWIPLDAQYKNANPNGDYFGVYDGACIIVAQDFCYDISEEYPIDALQSYAYWYWYDSGQCGISGSHEFYKNGVATGIESPSISSTADAYNLQGLKVSPNHKGISISQKKKIVRK